MLQTRCKCAPIVAFARFIRFCSVFARPARFDDNVLFRFFLLLRFALKRLSNLREGRLCGRRDWCLSPVLLRDEWKHVSMQNLEPLEKRLVLSTCAENGLYLQVLLQRRVLE